MNKPIGTLTTSTTDFLDLIPIPTLETYLDQRKGKHATEE
jgi:hypothetical protein